MRGAIRDVIVVALAFALAFWATVITPHAKACTVDRIEGHLAVVEFEIGGLIYFVNVPAGDLSEGQIVTLGGCNNAETN